MWGKENGERIWGGMTGNGWYFVSNEEGLSAVKTSWKFSGWPKQGILVMEDTEPESTIFYNQERLPVVVLRH